MSNTPETDAAIIASNGQWSFVLKETCQRLEPISRRPTAFQMKEINTID